MYFTRAGEETDVTKLRNPENLNLISITVLNLLGMYLGVGYK